LKPLLGQPVLIENVTGENGSIASAGWCALHQMVTVIAFLVCGVGGQSRKSIGRKTG
jgi:hypothetical protein